MLLPPFPSRPDVPPAGCELAQLTPRNAAPLPGGRILAPKLRWKRSSQTAGLLRVAGRFVAIDRVLFAGDAQDVPRVSRSSAPLGHRNNAGTSSQEIMVKLPIAGKRSAGSDFRQGAEVSSLKGTVSLRRPRPYLRGTRHESSAPSIPPRCSNRCRRPGSFAHRERANLPGAAGAPDRGVRARWRDRHAGPPDFE